ncbi:carbonic anhydrase-related protein [Elysia marginata]|uniref:Carbonic anhydrase-related protein n=1 Tax=Elysia marginata TaxID=1093978 RepID=A0AAV4H7W0_9GAST|nr:carbonic anhydrase-related protein [Elysia marginata]
MYYPEASGSSQSPIDLNSNDAIYEKRLADRPLKFMYSTSRETEVLNNGYTLVVFPRYKQGKRICKMIILVIIDNNRIANISPHDNEDVTSTNFITNAAAATTTAPGQWPCDKTLVQRSGGA